MALLQLFLSHMRFRPSPGFCEWPAVSFPLGGDETASKNEALVLF